MVDVHQTGPVNGFEFAEPGPGVVAVVHPPNIRTRPRREGHTGAVGHDVTDRGAFLAVPGVARQVIADPVVERERPALDEHVNHGGTDRLGCRVHTERGVGADWNPVGIGGIVGAVAPGVSDRPVEHHGSVVSQAELDCGLHPGAVPVPRCFPDPVDRRGIEAAGVFGADGGDGIEVARDSDASVASHCCRCRVALR